MPFAVDGSLKVLLRVLHAAHDPQMGVGMDGFRRCSRTEQLGDLGMAFGIGLGGEGEVLSVGLAFTGECGLKIVLGGHGMAPSLFGKSNLGIIYGMFRLCHGGGPLAIDLLERGGIGYNPRNCPQAWGEMSQFLGEAIMIDQQKTKEQLIEELADLRQREAQWRSVLAGIPVFVALVDRTGTMRYLNHTAPGHFLEDTIGKSTYDFLEPAYREIAKERIERVFDTGQSAFYETEGAGANGDTAWYETYVGPVKVEEQVVAVTLVSNDITRRKQAEQERDRTKLFSKRLSSACPLNSLPSA